ncbi:fimbrillin family protein [Phocaeicola sp.]
MKKQNLFNRLAGNLLLAGIFLSACSNNDLEKENTSTGTRMLTFNVSQSFNDSSDEPGRGLSITPDTINQKFDMGLSMEVIVEEDKKGQARNTTEAVAVGTKVLAFVIDAQANEIYRIHQLEVTSNNKLICEVPNRETWVVFYSYNSTTEMPTTNLQEGDKTTSVSIQNEASTKDLIWAKTELITSASTNLGSIKFSHLFSRVRICMNCDIGISGFQTNFSNCKYQQAAIDVINGTASPFGARSNIQLNSDYFNSPQTTIYSSYDLVTPTTGITGQLNITNISNTAISRMIIISNAVFQAGHSYTINVKIKNDKIVNGWQPYHYLWDAKKPLPTNITNDWWPEPGDDEYYNEASDIATHSCKGCPSTEIGKKIIANGALWDENGPLWTAYNGTSYTTGIWILKKDKLVSAGEYDGWSNVTMEKAEDVHRNSDDYVFLPAAGGFATRDGLGGVGFGVPVGEGAAYWLDKGTYLIYYLFLEYSYIYIQQGLPIHFGNNIWNY